MDNITYPEIATLLERHNADMDAAEAHGIATGMLCLDDRIAQDAWYNELFQVTPDLSESELSLLHAFFEQTRAILVSDEFEFDLFVPDAGAILSQQLVALRNWCSGFLFGVGYNHSSTHWPGDSGEILKDIIEFTKVDTETTSDEDEHAFMEITEYLRAAVLLLRDDIRGNESQLH